MKYSQNLFFFTLIVVAFMSVNVCAQKSVRSLNNGLADLRITVIILEDNKGEIIHNERTTGILNAKLLEMGFKPVIDANHAIKLHDAQLLENVYNGYPDEFIRTLDTVTDYLVIGRCTETDNDLSFTDYETGRPINSPLESMRVNLKIDVIVYDTGEIIGTFSTQGIGFGNNTARASDKAIETAANKAADKLEAVFKKFAERTTSQFLFKISADSYEKLDQALEDLRSISSVNFVQVREQRGKEMTLSVEAYQSPSMIVQLLKQRTSLKFYVERLSGNSCSLRFSEEEHDENVEQNFDDDDEKNFDDDSNRIGTRLDDDEH